MRRRCSMSVLFPRQRPREQRGHSRHVPGAHGDDQVPRLEFLLEEGDDLGTVRQPRHLLTRIVAQDGVDDRLSVDARDGRLARRVDVHDDDGIGVIERRPELARERFRARIAMRLKQHVDMLEVQL